LSKAITTRRELIKQSTHAAFKTYGSWKNLSALIVGSGFAQEKDFLVNQGIAEDNVSIVDFNGEWESHCSNNTAEIVLISITNADVTGEYKKLIEILQKLRNITSTKRIICVENEIIGYSKTQKIEDVTVSLKQIYLETLDTLEKSMGEESYLSFHDKLLKESKSEDYEKRLIYIFQSSDVKKHLTNQDIIKNFINAQIIALLNEHSSKIFESGFICGNDAEFEKILELFKPKMKWNDFKKSYPKIKDEKLCYLEINNEQLDLSYPLVSSEMWAELEKYAGQFLDLHCNKYFNSLNGTEKFLLTGDSKHEDTTTAVEEDEVESEAQSTFKKFEIDSNPLSAMMGGGPLMPSLSGSIASTPAISSSKKYFDLKEYGEIFLAMVAAWHRQCVFTGGALFEYSYKNDSEDVVQGCIITLVQNKELLIQVNKLSESLDLPKMKAKPKSKEVLDNFFKFQKNYTNYYDKVRSALASNHDFYIGEITNEGYEKIKKDEESLSEKFEIDLKQRKQKKKKQQETQAKSKQARMKVLKSLKVSRIKEYLENTDDEEVANEIIELDLSPEEAEELNQNLELKRLELEESLQQQREAREALETRILEEQEARNAKRDQIDLERKQKEETLLQEKLRRQQRLQEERKKREDVKQMRAKNLREAFEKAREAAVKKQENKQAMKAGDPSQKKKADKKKYNPEAIKMMLRFSTSDDKIMSTTGITADELIILKSEVAEEDKNL
jgi:hypothetical protein